jgi:hypothetical protein
MPYKDREKKRIRDRRWYHEHPEQWEGRSRKQYEKNPEYYNDRNAQRRQMLRELIQQQKIGRKCVRCGIDDPRVLDFHHRDKSTKGGGIGNAVSQNWSAERILQEITKCDTLCANCHRILHLEERNGARPAPTSTVGG